MEVTKLFNFCCAHSVKDAYTSRCDRERGGIHGHNYVVEVTLTGVIKPDGMVIDFTKLKERFNYIIDSFDHTFVINIEDKVLSILGPYLSCRSILFYSNPTAENMAQYFYDYLFFSLLNSTPEIGVKKVTVWETPTSFATCISNINYVRENIPKLSLSEEIVKTWTEEQREEFYFNNGNIHKVEKVISKIEQVTDALNVENTIRLHFA
jgi:6-pyruvoyltetrahydropterin/6-carboxytetrahydropterin synthase